MNDLLFFRLIALTGGIFMAASGLLLLQLKPGNLAGVEPLPRNRIAGMIGGWIALLWCVPHAVAVSPDFLLPFLYPLAVAVPIAAYFCLDYMFARALAGLIILFSYSIIHGAFEVHAALAHWLTVTAFLTGIGGIWISAKPCVMRDWLRKCAAGKRCRLICSIVLLLFGLLWVAGGIAA